MEAELLDILACPSCRARVKLEGARIVCSGCGRRYPVRNDIPVMLIEESTTEEDAGEKTG